MGSLKALEAKKAVVNEIVEQIKESKTIIFADNNGVTDSDNKSLRIDLRNNDSTYKVYKNTLAKLAFKEANIEINDEEFFGPKAIVFSKNVVEPAKIINDFAKSNKNLEIKFGVIDGEVVDSSTIVKMASIPPRDVLLATLASSMLGAHKNLAVCLELYKEEK